MNGCTGFAVDVLFYNQSASAEIMRSKERYDLIQQSKFCRLVRFTLPITSIAFQISPAIENNEARE